MKLDKRILPGKRPLGCFDTETAKEFIGKQCYFSDDAKDFLDLSTADGDSCFYIAELQNIWTAEEYCFADNSNDYRFILPCEWVKPEEPEIKYRPFSLNEFLKIFDIGDLIDFKKKNGDEVECVMFVGYLTDIDRSMDEKPGENIVMLGTYRYPLKSLFERYEMFFEDEWLPFGVEGDSE